MKDNIAFFDFDGTLIKGDSLILFLRTLRGPLRCASDLLTLSPWLIGYFIKAVPNHRAKERLLKRSLGGQSFSALQQQGQIFSDQYFPSLLRADVMQRLRHHQQQGHICVLVSASLDIYLRYWAQMIGFDYCICSELETDCDGKVTGRLVGGNCYGIEKVRRINKLLASLNRPLTTCAYGDSRGDLPMLGMVDEGFWVGSEIQRFRSASHA